MSNILFLLILCLQTQAKEIAISFDDAPRRLTGKFSNTERAKSIVKKLQEVNISNAVFFCNSEQINNKTKAALKIYDDAGFTIANHTHSHANFSEVKLEAYKHNFQQAEDELSKYSTYKKMFRFPYLREGNTKEKRDLFRQFLQTKQYQNAYITVDFSDWHLEDLLRKSLDKGEKVNLSKLRTLYISLAKESLDHYDSLAKKHLQRSPKHVLLLHETDLAALFLADLIKAMKSWGWKIISSEEAYKDPIANFQIERTLKYNPGRIGEIALDKGHPTSKIWAKSTYPSYISKRYEYKVLRK